MSVLRQLADQIIDRDAAANGKITIPDRGQGLPDLPDLKPCWLAANFPPEQDRSTALALSDTLIPRLMAADTLVLSLPFYNFGVPSALKSSIDQVARTEITFQFTATGPKACPAPNVPIWP